MAAEEELECLQKLGILLLAEWDVLAFLYRHGSSLASAEQIARLVGYESRVTGDALDRLESLGLVRRSRASKSVRLYQFVVSTDAARLACFQELMNLAQSRTGRLLLAAKLGPAARRAVPRGSMVSIKR